MFGRYDLPEGGNCPNGAYFGFVVTTSGERIECYARVQFRVTRKPQMRRDYYRKSGDTLQHKYFALMVAKLLPKRYRFIAPRHYARTFWAKPEDMKGF